MEVAMVNACFKIEIWMYTAKFTNMVVARFRKYIDLITESKMVIKIKQKL